MFWAKMAIQIMTRSPSRVPVANRSGPLRGGILSRHYIVQATPWGEYHVQTLLDQAQYWKHMCYQIVMPASLAKQLDPNAIHGARAGLAEQLTRIWSYLSPIEGSWLYGKTPSELANIGVAPIMDRVKEKVLYQLR
jgi:hypothetical protein